MTPSCTGPNAVAGTAGRSTASKTRWAPAGAPSEAATSVTGGFPGAGASSGTAAPVLVYSWTRTAVAVASTRPVTLRARGAGGVVAGASVPSGTVTAPEPVTDVHRAPPCGRSSVAYAGDGRSSSSGHRASSAGE